MARESSRRQVVLYTMESGRRERGMVRGCNIEERILNALGIGWRISCIQGSALERKMERWRR